MKTIQIEAGPGTHFNKASQQAKEAVGNDKEKVAEFDFNGITCLVDYQTNLEWLYRDYCNAHRMEWKVVGPHCTATYSNETMLEIDDRNRIASERQAKAHEAQRAKEAEEKRLFEEKTKGISVKWKDDQVYDDWKAKNTDPYGKACFEFAEDWAKLMHYYIDRGEIVKDCADKASHEVAFHSISGAQYGMAKAILYQCWVLGDALKIVNP